MAVEDADDLYVLLDWPIDYQMRTTGINPHPRGKLGALTGDFRELRQKIEEREQTIGIILRLFDTPGPGPLQPDV
jgi:hypothetical protein